MPLHAAAPVMVLAMVEAGRTMLLRRLGVRQGTVRDSIPMVRWVLAPWRTALLWRRMVLWQVTSYRAAVDVELEIRRAVARLRLHYGRGWRRHAPGDLVWMLRTGVGIDEACARVEELVDAPAVHTRSVAEPGAAVSPLAVSTLGGSRLVPPTVDEVDGRFAEAVCFES